MSARSEGAAEFLGWRLLITSADKLRKLQAGDALDALIGGYGTAIVGAGSRLAPPRGKHFKKPKGLEKILGIFGKGAKALASWHVGLAATAIDYGCDWLDKDK